MKVYVKVHQTAEIETIACCDEDILNQEFVEGNLKIQISQQFYGGQLLNIDEAIAILYEASNFNIVGKNIVNTAVDCKILSKEGIRLINGIPIGLKMRF